MKIALYFISILHVILKMSDGIFCSLKNKIKKDVVILYIFLGKQTR